MPQHPNEPGPAGGHAGLAPAHQYHQLLGILQAPKTWRLEGTRRRAGLIGAWVAVIILPMTDARILVRLQARAHRDELVGLRDEVLFARVRAPPVDGRANRAVCRLIAREAGVAASRVTIVRGERSREKLLRVSGVDASAFATRSDYREAGDSLSGPERQCRIAPSRVRGRSARSRPWRARVA